jgi:GalNAc-alpha-(1->4)-GalNAc-alpha-(1->3)-diNAcBac-PP-undecaprenol alpha-1,4-N-acetyl-D-galactosaminyltransferase
MLETKVKMDIKSKRICLVIHSLQAGGMERVMAELAGHFSKKENTQLHLILYGINRDIFYPLPSNIIIYKPSFVFDDGRRLLSTAKTLNYLRCKIKEIKPDTILSFGEYWNNFVLMATLGLRYPVFVSDRSQPDKSLGKTQDKLRNWLYPFAKGIIAQTAKAKEIYQAMYRHSNVTVIGNPIRQIHTDEEGGAKENIVLMVGRLIKTKHQDKLIEMFVNINKPDWKLIIIGYDHLKQNNLDNLKQLVKDLKAENKVELAGKQSDVEQYYRKSKIFAFTSSSEGFPNVIGEAMSACLPVVAFDCVAGPSEMITNNENGFLIPLFDYSLFQEKLNLLMTDAELREKMGNNAKQSIKRFDAENIGDQFFSFILSAN